MIINNPNRYAIFVVGVATQIVFSATFLGLPAASLLLRSALDLSTGGLALMLGAASLAVVFVETPWGVAADRFGERRVLLTGIIGTVLSLSLLAFATWQEAPLWVMSLLLFVAAASGGAVTGPSGSAILGWFGERRHGTLLSLRVAAVPVGGALGTVLYAWLLSVASPFIAFSFFAGLCLLCALLVWVLVFDPAKVAPAAHIHRSTFRSGAIWRVATSGFLLDVTQFLVLTFSVVMLAEIHRLPAITGVVLVTVMQLAGGGFRVVLGICTDLIGTSSRTIAVRMLAGIQVVCLVVFLVLPQPAAVAGSCLLIITGIASCAWQGVHFTHIAALAGARSAGAALGLNNAATSLGAFLPQVLVGVLVEANDWPLVILLLGVAPAAAATVIFPPGTRTQSAFMARREVS
ncbi:MFS transporter [Microbacterium sp. ISL-103]|uniref:MFS transporter n=1 Tax=Microbacterium sp. ISL-103 TaxID=2819156 RepID=UPI001BE7BE59|nr:MFS transporter [Microbacterium sp. ISL-103]MBT2475737.1 MFS transporter [Microbacterium sp. ISL-103]